MTMRDHSSHPDGAPVRVERRGRGGRRARVPLSSSACATTSRAGWTRSRRAPPALERFGDVTACATSARSCLTDDRTRGRAARLVRRPRPGSSIRGPVRVARAAVLAARGGHARPRHRRQRRGVRRGEVGSARRAALCRRRRNSCASIVPPATARSRPSAGTVSDIRERQRSFSERAHSWPRDARLHERWRRAQIVKMMWIEPDLFRTLGVSPIRGPRLPRRRRSTTRLSVMISHGRGSGSSGANRRRRQNDSPQRTSAHDHRRAAARLRAPGGRPTSIQPLGRRALHAQSGHRARLALPWIRRRLKPGVREAAQRGGQTPRSISR